MTNVTNETSIKTLGGKTVKVRATKENSLRANDVNVIERKVVVPNGKFLVSIKKIPKRSNVYIIECRGKEKYLFTKSVLSNE